MDPYLDFVDWRCRVFFNDTTPQCTDEEYAVFDACLEGYPDLIDPKPCTDRANSEALNEQLSFVVPLAVVGFIFLVLFACYLAMLHSARNLAYRSWIDFNDLNLTLDKAGNPVSNILGMSLKGMMSATWHGQKVRSASSRYFSLLMHQNLRRVFLATNLWYGWDL